MHVRDCSGCQCKNLRYSQSVKYRGMYIDNNLKWNLHVNHIPEELRALSAQFYFLQTNTLHHVLNIIYNSLGKFISSYGISFYGHCTTYLSNKIEIIQKRIAKNTISSNDIKSDGALFKMKCARIS